LLRARRTHGARRVLLPLCVWCVQAVVDELEANNIVSYPVSTRRDRIPFGTQDFAVAYNGAVLDG
jgi:hypothetical protein